MSDLGKAVLKSGASPKGTNGIAQEKKQFNESHGDSWVEDDECTTCSGCAKPFLLTRRRHHCRECGKIFCSKCSKYQVVVAGRVRRACLPCYKKVIEQSQSSAQNQLQDTPDRETRKGSISENLAATRGSNPRASVEGAAKDDIYGRLDFAGGDSGGFLTACDGDSAEQKLSTLESSFDATAEGSADILSPWIHAILFIRTDDSMSPVLEASVPRGRISEGTMANILDHSMPEILDPADGYPKSLAAGATADDNEMIEYNYTYRVRCQDEEDDVSSLEGDNFLNCYVAFREVMNPTAKAMRRQSLVIVTRWPFPHFAYRLLGKIEEALWHVFTTGPIHEQVTVPGTEGSKLSRAAQALHVAYGQFLSWPPPAPDTPLSLPFFGEILQMTLPGSMFAQHQAKTPMAAEGAPHHGGSVDGEGGKRMAPVYAQCNLISVFGPLGLVPHLWAFWEILMTGRDIVVVAERPSLCSEVVIALSTLAQPKGFRGEVWPFVSARGGLAEDISKMLKEKAQTIDALAAAKSKAGSKKWNPQEHIELLKTARFSSIIGVTNPALLKQFDGVSTVVFASSSPVSWFGLDRYSSRLSASMRVYDSTQTFSEKSKGGNLSCCDFYMSSYRLWSRGIHRVLTGIDKREVTTLFAVQDEPTSSEQQRITKRLRKLSKKDYLALGSILLRDHFSDLTRAFHKPLEETQVTPALPTPVIPVEPQPSVRQRLREERPLLSDRQERKVKVRKWVNSTVDWMQNNRPTVIMNITIAVSIVFYVWLGLPIILIVVAIYFMQIPEKAPKGIEIMLQGVFPKSFLYPNKYKPVATSAGIATRPTAVSTTPSEAATGGSTPAGPVDFSGVWKRVKTVNFDTFVGAQGASFVQKKLAASITITHTITMNPPTCDMMRIQQKGGPSETDNLFEIGGAEQELLQGKKTFLDSCYWCPTEPGVLEMKKIHLPDKDFEIIGKRYLEGNTIRMTFLYREYASGKEVEATAYFDRVGDSPNAPPESTAPKKEDPSSTAGDKAGSSASGSSTPGMKKRVNLSGAWQAIRRVNIEAYVGAQGAGYVQRKLAANAPMTHTFTTDDGAANYLGIRIQEKAGPIDTDVSYVVNGSKSTRSIMKKNFTESVTWEDGALVLRRVHEAGDYELVLTRRLEDGSDGCPELVLNSLHRDLLTGKETEATIVWKKIGPSPNPPVVVPADLMNESADGDAASPEVNASAGDEGDSSDDDTDGGDDDIALPASAGKSHFPRALSTAPRADMTGVWKRVEAQNYDAFVGAQGAGYVQRKLAASMALQHTIILDPPLFSEFVLQEKGGPLDTNLHYDIGSDKPVENLILKKKFWDTCDWEGGALVLTRRHDAGDFELVFRRYLENKDGEPVIRLVAIHRNLKTGDETESISFFRKVGDVEKK